MKRWVTSVKAPGQISDLSFLGKAKTKAKPGEGTRRLQTGGVDHLVVNHQFATTIIDDKKATLGNNGETLLDVTVLGDGDDAVVLTEVKDAVGLVDGAEHGLDSHGGRGVGDEAGLFVEFTGEEIDTEVALLAGLGRNGDANHLGGAALENENVANADEVRGDRDGLSGRGAADTRLDDADILTDTNWAAFVSDSYIFAGMMIMVIMVVVEGVRDAVHSAFHTTTEGVVVTVVVVVTHLASWGVINYGSSLVNLDVAVGRSRSRLDSLYRNLTVDLRAFAGNVVGWGLVRTVVRDVVLSRAVV
ncbi:hypothetical protein BJX70DRAFT_19512 [Aspergillus crustosus]